MLFENGFAGQVSIHPRPWYALGFTYTNSAGDWSLTPGLLPTTIQQQLDGALGQLKSMGLISANYVLLAPVRSTTQFGFGLELTYRHFRQNDALSAAGDGWSDSRDGNRDARDAIAQIVAGALLPSGSTTGWAGFIGFGGGVDILVTHHCRASNTGGFGLRSLVLRCIQGRSRRGPLLDWADVSLREEHPEVREAR